MASPPGSCHQVLPLPKAAEEAMDLREVFWEERVHALGHGWVRGRCVMVNKNSVWLKMVERYYYINYLLLG